jgi:hypothetical protein
VRSYKFKALVTSMCFLAGFCRIIMFIKIIFGPDQFQNVKQYLWNNRTCHFCCKFLVPATELSKWKRGSGSRERDVKFEAILCNTVRVKIPVLCQLETPFKHACTK